MASPDVYQMNIEQLLRAADFIERKERSSTSSDVIEAEHGYATTLPMPSVSRRKNNKLRKSQQGSRFIHNELEKNRRAHLRFCLDRLKDTVPLGSSGATRHTTLGLINKAKALITSLTESDKRLRAEYESQIRHAGLLRRRLELLSRQTYRDAGAGGHSLSESSTGSSRSSSSTFSEQDDVDVIGFGGSGALSDSDDVGSEDYGYQTNVHGLSLEDNILR